ncbi:MAG: asparagine synthase (glutamine-hydrolyzing) [Acidobacteria bacterium]|nr:MAG: asparagine synthase (glutamine-hydrolyzing) [Acidobacteriota bacterium]
MCGFAGLVRREGPVAADQRRRLAALGAALEHRGPDDAGEWSSGRAALAFRRLAIRDPSPAGRQPMRHESGLVIAYNGEIYNADTLREALRDEGETFRGRSDTEVLLAACARWGLATALERIRGMYAFALVDERSGALTLVRDRLGIKPLCWALGEDGALWFASELGPLMREAPVDRRLDPDALATCLQLGFVPAPRTVFAAANVLPAGHLLRWDGQGAPHVERWWEPVPRRDEGLAEREACERLDALLRTAVERQLVADVPLGALLSGGLDSSALCALIRESGRELATFSVGFEGEPVFDESHWARAVAAHLGTRHVPFVVGPAEVEQAILDVIGTPGQPLGDPSLVPTFLVARLARRQVTVVLSGDGADELFAGYDKYRVEDVRQRFGRAGRVALAAMRPLLARLPESRTGRAGETVRRLRRLAATVPLDGPERWRTLQAVLAPPSRAVALLAPALRHETAPPEPVARALAAADDGLSGMLLADLSVTLPERMLHKVDLASMAASLEVRVPFLDEEVVDLALRLPERLLRRRGRGKWILRRVAGPRLPASMRHRPKQGFEFPAGRWLTGALADAFRDAIRSGPARALVDVDAVERLVEDHRSRRVAADRALWSVFAVAVWAARMHPYV